MRIKFTLLSLILLFAIIAPAQSLTGIWRGYFVQRSFGVYEDRYKFELQIEQLENNGINGVTYSYKTTVFYGKANLKGMWTRRTKNLVITETKLVDVKIRDNSEPCLMTCYLDYDKMGSLETLTGTYTSSKLQDKSDCGSGTVYLEKTTQSDFYKEEFLVKRESALKKKLPTMRTNPPTAKQNSKTNPPVKDLGIKPGAEGNLSTKPTAKAPVKTLPEPDAVVVPPQKQQAPITPKIDKPVFKKPEVIKSRSNELVKTFNISEKEFTIELYDNGEIDGDTISVYHNNELIVSKKRLSDKPIRFTIKTDENTPHHDFVMVAENLGSIPPNTALMVITAGTKRYELFVTSTEQKNAVVTVEYSPN